MNASCLDEKGRFKSCPYRVYTDEHKAILRGQGDFTSQCFSLTVIWITNIGLVRALTSALIA